MWKNLIGGGRKSVWPLIYSIIYYKENPDQVNGGYWPLLYKRAELDLKSTNVFRQNQGGQKDYLACPDMSAAGAEVNNGLCS